MKKQQTELCRLQFWLAVLKRMSNAFPDSISIES